MIPKSARGPCVLVVTDDQEMRHGIWMLLDRDSYHVELAGSESEAARAIQSCPPDLILLSPAGTAEHILAVARRIRNIAGLPERTPIVLFSITHFPEGIEEHIGRNIFVIAPDNFGQIRALVARLLTRA